MLGKQIICPACGQICRQVGGSIYWQEFICPNCGCKVQLTGQSARQYAPRRYSNAT
ncbi:MAG: hypothetical protein IJF90_12935 [Synergistaceae bacterium]|nr:hypothetical protein [Synergistaceae bacterium]